MKPETKEEKDFADKVVPRSPWKAVALKLVLMGLRGFPDRTILAEGGKIFFIEFKSPGEQLKPNQVNWKKTLTKLGFKFYVCYSSAEAKKIYYKEMESA